MQEQVIVDLIVVVSVATQHHVVIVVLLQFTRLSDQSHLFYCRQPLLHLGQSLPVVRQPSTYLAQLSLQPVHRVCRSSLKQSLNQSIDLVNQMINQPTNQSFSRVYCHLRQVSL